MLRDFFKMTGSGNDFVFFDARQGDVAELREPATIQAICARGTGVGADGIVLLESAEDADFRMVYHNADGSRATMCGNAALCSTALSVRLGIARPGALRFLTDSGPVTARIDDGEPEIDLAPVTDVRAGAPVAPAEGERQIGFAVVGVPHLVIRCDDVDRADVVGRGGQLRWSEWHPGGMNVNFVSPGPQGAWRIRTFERGVEAETLACGTGTVATALLLHAWGAAGDASHFGSRSGARLRVRLGRAQDGSWRPALRGEGRLVFAGQLQSFRSSNVASVG